MRRFGLSHSTLGQWCRRNRFAVVEPTQASPSNHAHTLAYHRRQGAADRILCNGDRKCRSDASEAAAAFRDALDRHLDELLAGDLAIAALTIRSVDILADHVDLPADYQCRYNGAHVRSDLRGNGLLCRGLKRFHADGPRFHADGILHSVSAVFQNAATLVCRKEPFYGGSDWMMKEHENASAHRAEESLGLQRTIVSGLTPAGEVFAVVGQQAVPSHTSHTKHLVNG